MDKQSDAEINQANVKTASGNADYIYLVEYICVQYCPIISCFKKPASSVIYSTSYFKCDK